MNHSNTVSKTLTAAILVVMVVSTAAFQSEDYEPPSETCLVLHAVTPVQVCLNDQSLKHQFRFLGDDEEHEGPLLPSFAQLATSYPDDHDPEVVELYRGTNEGTNKEVVVQYSVTSRLILVSTSYVPRSNETRAYEFNIDAEGTVTHTAW